MMVYDAQTCGAQGKWAGQGEMVSYDAQPCGGPKGMGRGKGKGKGKGTQGYGKGTRIANLGRWMALLNSVLSVHILH
jgi:hypothetical protein